MVKTVQRVEPAEELPGSDDSHQVESLDNIAQLGTSLEVKTVAPGQVTAEKAEDKAAAAEIAGALELLRAAAVPLAGEHVQGALNAVWSDKQLEEIAKCIVEICKLQGIGMDVFFDRYGPYIRLIAALGLPALATIKLLKMPPPPKAAADGQQQ